MGVDMSINRVRRPKGMQSLKEVMEVLQRNKDISEDLAAISEEYQGVRYLNLPMESEIATWRKAYVVHDVVRDLTGDPCEYGELVELKKEHVEALCDVLKKHRNALMNTSQNQGTQYQLLEINEALLPLTTVLKEFDFDRNFLAYGTF